MYADMSDIARLRRQIIQEMEAMQQVFQGFAVGVARHDFIQARVRNINEHQQHLEEYMDKSDAATMVCELYIDNVKGP